MRVCFYQPHEATTESNKEQLDMLLYIRDAEREQILAPVLSEEIPPHLRERFEKQEAEKAAKKKEKAEAHLYMELKVIDWPSPSSSPFPPSFVSLRLINRWPASLTTKIGMALILLTTTKFSPFD